MDNLISVIMPVYNGELYIEKSIKSILNQSYNNFELIIVNDGSTDNTLLLINGFKDKRIIVINQKNSGTSVAMNAGLKAAKGSYIARMDHDDISKINRLELQVGFLKKNPEYGAVGSHALKIDTTGRVTGFIKHPISDDAIKVSLLRNTPFVHSSVMFSKEVFNKVGLYSIDPLRQPPEDYELFSRIQTKFKLANLDDYLVEYRELATGLSNTLKPHIRDRVIKISQENIARFTKNDYFCKVSADILGNYTKSINISHYLITPVVYFLALCKIVPNIRLRLIFLFPVLKEILNNLIKNIVKKIIGWK